MKGKLETWLNMVSGSVVTGFAFLTPLLFWNITSDFFDTPKFIFLLAIIAVLILLLCARWLIEGKVTLTKSPLDIPLILVLLAMAVSTFFAFSRPTAIFGNMPKIHGGLIAFAAYIVFYFTLVSNLRSSNIVKQIIYALVAAASVLSVLALMSYAKLNVFSLSWTSALNFTPAGSSFSLVAFLTLVLPFPLIALIQGLGEMETGDWFKIDKFSANILWTLALALFAITIVLLGSLTVIAAAALVLVLVLLTASPTSLKKATPFIFTPVLVAAALAIVSFLPLGGSKNILYTQAQAFPREIQLPFDISWKISVSAFRDAPFWGTGPASYLSNFSYYKPIEFNNLKYWNIRFDTAFNEYFQFLGSLGALGLIALLLLTVVFVAAASKTLAKPKDGAALAIAISGLTFFIILALHGSSMLLWITGILILASFVAINKNLTSEFKLSETAHTGSSAIKTDALAMLLTLIFVVSLGTLTYFCSQYISADIHHRQALSAIAQNNGILAYTELVKAETLNPNIDLYRSDMAQTNFALANAIASSKGPTESSPSGSLTEEDKNNIQTLLVQAINEGRVATTLNPNNPGNWEVLGSIYRQISGVAENALAFALDSYGRAIQRDPLNPTLRLTIGGIYYTAKNYDMAIRFFTDAANLKPDYANAYYNLAIAYKDKGDLATAAQAAEKTVSLLDPKEADYQKAAELLSELKGKVTEKQQQETVKPTPTPTSALQNKKLQTTLDLPKPEKVSTPEAVKVSPTPKEEVNPTTQPTP